MTAEATAKESWFDWLSKETTHIAKTIGENASDIGANITDAAEDLSEKVIPYARLLEKRAVKGLENFSRDLSKTKKEWGEKLTPLAQEFKKEALGLWQDISTEARPALESAKNYTAKKMDDGLHAMGDLASDSACGIFNRFSDPRDRFPPTPVMAATDDDFYLSREKIMDNFSNISEKDKIKLLIHSLQIKNYDNDAINLRDAYKEYKELFSYDPNTPINKKPFGLLKEDGNKLLKFRKNMRESSDFKPFGIALKKDPFNKHIWDDEYNVFNADDLQKLLKNTFAIDGKDHSQDIASIISEYTQPHDCEFNIIAHSPRQLVEPPKTTKPKVEAPALIPFKR